MNIIRSIRNLQYCNNCNIVIIATDRTITIYDITKSNYTECFPRYAKDASSVYTYKFQHSFVSASRYAQDKISNRKTLFARKNTFAVIFDNCYTRNTFLPPILLNDYYISNRVFVFFFFFFSISPPVSLTETFLGTPGALGLSRSRYFLVTCPRTSFTVRYGGYEGVDLRDQF